MSCLMSASRVSLISLPHCAAPPPLTRAARGARLFQDVDSLSASAPAQPGPGLHGLLRPRPVMQHWGRLPLVTPGLTVGLREREWVFSVTSKNRSLFLLEDKCYRGSKFYPENLNASHVFTPRKSTFSPFLIFKVRKAQEKCGPFAFWIIPPHNSKLEVKTTYSLCIAVLEKFVTPLLGWKVT